MIYDDWKPRSDRDDDWWNEPEPEPEPEEEPDMDEISKQLSDALEKDFPGLKLKHAPHAGNGEPKPGTNQPTISRQIDTLIAGLEARIALLQELRATL
jgi:hypothetical protein